MTPTVETPPQADKRTRILQASLELIASSGLHNTPMSAIARKAGVAAGTLYLYFADKNDLINALFLEQRKASAAHIQAHVDPDAPLEDRLQQCWMAMARRHIQHPEAFNFVQQCEASGILSADILAEQSRIEAPLLRDFYAAIEQGIVKDLSRQMLYALMIGPITLLAHMQTKGEIEVTDHMLQQTYSHILDGIRPSTLLRHPFDIPSTGSG